MTEGKQKAEKRVRDVSRALRDVVIDASDNEMRESLEAAGEDFDELAKRGRGAVLRALDQAITASDRHETGAGTDAAVQELHRSLGVLIQMLRRRDRLSEEQLANRAGVTVEEVRRIEFDPTYSPKPRTIFQLEQHFALPARTLVCLSGVKVRYSEDLRSQAVRFAAQSTGIGKLTRDEKHLLNAFVRYLSECDNT